uniref:MAX gene-associated protein n=1 Tax=Microcebus murinus TaxID=30608 RepID=A0A8C6ECQ1_MICMU
MEEKQIILANQDGGTVAGAAPTFFVILKQPGNGKTDQGILVTNRDACALASSVSSPGKSKGKICLPADCTLGGITVTLDNNSMWNEFYHRSTEMILTKQGRRMFPYCRYWITGLDSNLKYILVMDISPVDNHRYKWNGRWWEPSGKAEPHVLGRVFIHPESPSTGHYWMHQPVSFYKLKLTNNTLDQEGHIILHSMHRYLPRLHLVPAEKATEVIQLNGPGVHTFTFPQTEFFAVTAYQNIQITQLKIDYNPFAKGFRDDGLNSKPQRDGKQKNSSDQEGNSVPSSPGHRVRLIDGEGLEIQPGDLDPVSRGHETFGKGLEKTSLNIKRDFLGFMDNDSALEVPQLKQEVSESLVANNFEDGSRIVSPLDPNGSFNVVIKEEPLDDYDYEIGECPEGVTVKQEETDEETDVYSNSDDDPILEKQLKRHNKVDNLEADHLSSNWLPSSPSGVAKAKMFKLDSGKMPVVYLEPCAVTKSTVKISELPDNMLSASRKDKSSMLAELEYLPTYIENSSETGFCLGKESENGLGRHSPDLRVVQKYPLLKETPWKYPDISDSISTERILDSSKDSTGDSLSEKEDLGRKRTTMLKIAVAPKAVSVSQNAPSNVPGKRGRPRKLKLSKAGRPPKNTGKSLTATKNTPVGPGSTFPDVKPDLEDVDGVLFVSFESKEALDIHAVDGTTEEPSSLQASTTNDPGCRARISQLEKELIEDLKSLRHKQVIHPGLQEVGLKLNSVDPTMSIDLKYLGVQLPLAPATSFPFWNLTGTNPASPDAGFPFVSRTGKTNDFTKIKGWRGKFHSASASRNEGGNSESSLKNRSAFCSDKLDEYLENEGKLMETNMGFSANAPTSPVVYQLPTKSTSYVRTLDSVLKKQSTISPSTSYSLKPHSVPAASRKAKSQNKQATFSGRTKSSYKSILPYSVSPKQKHSHMILGDKVTKNFSSTISENQVNNLVVPTLDENVFPKQISLRQAQQQQQQQQQGTRPPGLSKSQVKLMDLEDCALWEGKPRTYITEERADVSLTTLLTAQASLKTKPIHTIIRKRAPPCNNDFCRLGCVCSSLALEKRQPAHCRRPDCMFGCTCLKRKVVLVKGGSKAKHFQRKSAHRDPVFYDTLGEEAREEEEGVKEEEEQLKEKKKRKKLEYTICETEPEQPVRHYPLWVKVEGEVDPEPVYIPTPSVIEPMKPLLLPQPEVLSTTVKGKLLTGIKPARAYTPKPNPVIREEDKDPVYLYFESMMTCARVRVYERKKEEQRQPSPSPSPSPSFQQQSSCHSSPENYTVKEPDSEQQPLKQLTCDLEEDSDKSQEKSWKSSCNEGESSSTSYMHQRSPGGPTKLIEIISDCNWEEDRNKILSILSQHINSSMPQSLKVGSFIIELASQRKSRGEKNPPVYSSRVKISMPSCQDQDDMAEKSGSETPDGPLSPGKMDDISPVQTDALDSVRERLHGGKGLPFYAGLSPAGKLVAYKRKPSSSTSGLIQVASNAKVAASRKPRTLLPSTSNSKMASSGATTNRPGKNLKAFVPAKRPIALEKHSIRERWRKHLKGPLTRKSVRTSQECKKEADEQLIKETKTCQENSDVFQEQGISDLLGKSGIIENARVLKMECDSWSRISNPPAFSIVPRRATKGSRGNGHFQGHLLLPGEQIKLKQEKKGGRSSADFTVLDLEEDDEEDENEKTDDSIDEIVDVITDYQSEEVDDVEKNNCVEYIEDDEEQVDIETIEELSEEINVAHMKTTAAHTQSFKQPCRTHSSTDEKAAERSRKAPPVPLKLKSDYWSDKLQKEAEAFAYYRRTHTANERRRRGEMRDLFEKLKATLGLLHSSKVSKSLILTRAFSEIQGLTDQADKLIGQKNLLTRKRNILIRKVSSLSGKTEEVVLKKLEYIYAKQQALEAQKRKKKMGSDEFDVSHRSSKQQEGSSASSVDVGQMFINNRRGKPLILSRKRDQATENTSPSNTPHTSANLVMTPQGQLLTLKGPLFSGPVVTVSPGLLEADLKPQVGSSAMPQSENDDLFMMPRIVNVTSLATDGSLVDMGGSKYPHEVPDGKPPDHLTDTIRNKDNSLEDSGRISSRGNHRDGRMTLGPTQVFLANKDSGFPQIVDVSSMQEAQEFLPKKISGDIRGIQYKWKENESRGERLKSKQSSFHKLKMKDLKDSSIEMELRKVTSAIEEAALDSSELLTNMEDEDDTDETLTSLLNEIAFLNQQLNDDTVSLAELPSTVDTEFPGDARRGFISKLPSGNSATFQVGHLGTGLKELPDVQGESDSTSPLLLHLEDDDFSENEKQLAEPASEPDVLKIVIDSEIKDSLISHRKTSDGGKSTSDLPAEPESVSSPPLLHMRTGLENSSSTDTLWRPMPKLAPLGLKVANPCNDADGQSLKVMPCLAPIAAKVGSVGHKMNLTGSDQEGRESKVMPTLAPVLAKLGNSGVSPSSAGK